MGGRSKTLSRTLSFALAAAVSAGALITPKEASAFCGFYVGGADKKLFNNATIVVLMREGTRTVLSMQNNYQGPPDNFAMVVPVPVVLQKENVKTLPKEVFDRIDQLAAPRLVEYWERDPCYVDVRYDAPGRGKMRAAAPAASAAAESGVGGVKVEAQFTVGEYEIVILSAEDSTGLDTWLKANNYNIPDGAEPALRPYVQAGSKFFVAKVDASKVKMENGMASLSPLRFHYDTETFSLPVRLGLLSSPGTQDLLVHVLAKRQRYNVANYTNVTIPTNIDIDEKAQDQFPAFYAALFDKTLEENIDSDKRPPVVTEYSWDASSCDPCPGPPLQPNDIVTLGADVMPGSSPDGPGRFGSAYGYVITRLHARYTKDQLGEDLVFQTAEPIAGGREVFGRAGVSRESKLETGATKGSGVNNFQGRYAIRHPWTGPIECDKPVRGVWGGPPAGTKAPNGTKAARDLAFAPRGKTDLAALVRHDVPEIHLIAKAKGSDGPGGLPLKDSTPQSSAKGCGSCQVGDSSTSEYGLSLMIAALLAWSRRSRKNGVTS